MKSTIKLALAAGAIAFTAGMSSAAYADIVVTSWGGGYTASQQKAYGESWEAKTGKKINWENYNGGLGEVRAMVEAGTRRGISSMFCLIRSVLVVMKACSRKFLLPGLLQLAAFPLMMI